MNDFTVTLTEDISLVVLNKAPGDVCFVSSVFELLGNAGVNADMISQAPSQGAAASLAFTVKDTGLPVCLKVIADLREAYPGISSAVSGGNVKVLIAAESMRNTPGAAAEVFRRLAVSGTDIRLITTAETEISLLVAGAEKDKVVEALR